jgi:ATP-dependent protease ClpP protease subunit
MIILFLAILIVPRMMLIIRLFNGRIWINRFLWRRKNDLVIISKKEISEELIEKMNIFFLGSKTDEVDIIINTPGGDIFSTQAVIDVLKHYNKPKNIFIPYYSMSGGSLLALSCDKIFMTPISSMGCVDPQIGIWYKGIFSKSSLEYAIKNKRQKAEDETYILKFIAAQYEKTIRSIVRKIRPELPESTIRTLTNGKLEHGYRITPKIAKKMGINVQIIDDTYMQRILYALTRLRGINFYYYKKPRFYSVLEKYYGAWDRS